MVTTRRRSRLPRSIQIELIKYFCAGVTARSAAGMGVGLLYWGTAEPLTHYLLISEYEGVSNPPAFLFIVTSVISAAFVLGMFSTRGDPNPTTRVKLSWGVVLGPLGLVMILSGSVNAVKSIIALGARPFVFIVLLLVVCLLKALREENL